MNSIQVRFLHPFTGEALTVSLKRASWSPRSPATAISIRNTCAARAASWGTMFRRAPGR